VKFARSGVNAVSISSINGFIGKRLVATEQSEGAAVDSFHPADGAEHQHDP